MRQMSGSLLKGIIIFVLQCVLLLESVKLMGLLPTDHYRRTTLAGRHFAHFSLALATTTGSARGSNSLHVCKSYEIEASKHT